MRRCWPVSSFDSAYKVEAGAKAATATEAAVELFHHYSIAKRLFITCPNYCKEETEQGVIFVFDITSI